MGTVTETVTDPNFAVALATGGRLDLDPPQLVKTIVDMSDITSRVELVFLLRCFMLLHEVVEVGASQHLMFFGR